MNTFNDQTFWKDGYEGVARGGIFIRAVELKKFLHQIEESETGGEIVGNVKMSVTLSRQHNPFGGL